MTIEEDSILFLERHIDTTFNAILSKFVVNNIDWLSCGDNKDPVLRPYATLMEVLAPHKKSNLIVLFPPFNPNKESK